MGIYSKIKKMNNLDISRFNIKYASVNTNGIKQLISCDTIDINGSTIILTKINGTDIEHYIKITLCDPEIIYLNKLETKVDSIDMADSIIIYDDAIKIRLYSTYTNDNLVKSILC